MLCDFKAAIIHKTFSAIMQNYTHRKYRYLENDKLGYYFIIFNIPVYILRNWLLQMTNNFTEGNIPQPTNAVPLFL